MTRPYTRLLTFAYAGSALTPLLTLIGSRYEMDHVFPWHAVPGYALYVIEMLLASAGVRWLLRRSENAVDKMGMEQAAFLQDLPERYVRMGIFGAAALSLFLELSMVRWQATVFPFFAFYKNFSILACFAGLGLGYATSREKRIPLFLALPLFCWQFVLLLGLRYGIKSGPFASLSILPFANN